MKKKSILAKISATRTLAFAILGGSMLLTSSTLFAQVKIGTNPTTIEAASNLEVEASTGSRKVKVDKTTGQLTVKDGTEGTGRVFTSDANGGGSWQNMDVSCNGFEASTASQTISVSSTPSTLLPSTELFDQSNSYNPATGIFTVPVTGTYVFAATAADGGSATGTRNSIMHIQSNTKGNLASANTASSPFGYGTWMTVSGVTRATAGEQIKLVYAVTYVSGASQSTIPVSSIRFSGSRIDCNK